MFHARKYPVHLPKRYSSLIEAIFMIAMALLTNTCAAIVQLEGGPKDTVPPKLVKTYPAQESTNTFQGQKEKHTIQLTFDKEIEIQDLYNKLIVTPKLAQREEGASYVSKVKKNVLELSLEVPLEEDTTYTFNFKDAIRDTHEGTPAENPTLSFSTGTQVDSMYITGQVKTLMTDQPTKALVALYRLTEGDPTHILNSKPDYFTESKGEDGTFRLNHLKKGTYRLCAGQSKDNKLTIDPSKESYGFMATPVELTKSTENISLYIVQANINEFKVQSSKPQGPYFEISLSKPIHTYHLQLKHIPKRLKNSNLYSYLIEEGTTIRVYNTLGLLADDLLEAVLMAEDEMGNTIQQDIKLQFKDKRVEKVPFKYTMQPVAGSKINPKLLQVDIKLSKPIKDIQVDKLAFLTEKNEKWPISLADIIIHPHRDVITIQKNIHLTTAFNNATTADTLSTNNEGKDPAITLQIDQGAFVSVEKELNEPGTHKYLFKTSQECGSIKGRVITKATGFIIQLLDREYQVVDEIRNQRYYKFKDVLPGNYWIRVLVTSTKEGTWNFGNINKLLPPDPVIFYPQELAIVAKWELENIDLMF